VSIALELAGALDPALFAERCGLTPDPWQASVLRSRANMLLNCCRQSGKSTTTSVKALHVALHEPQSLILLLSPGERQSKELFTKCVNAYRRLGRPVSAETENKLELELANGSRIVALPGNEATVRSFSGVRLLIVDEAARVQDPLYFAVRPMLAVSQGQLLALSTPFGRSGWWAEAWHSGANWVRIEVPATQCPRITPGFLAEERAALGDYWHEQEYLCQFKEDVASVFSREEIRNAFNDSIEPLFPDDQPKAAPTPVWNATDALDNTIAPLFDEAAPAVAPRYRDEPGRADWRA
jgi:hypothetical protein